MIFKCNKNSDRKIQATCHKSRILSTVLIMLAWLWSSAAEQKKGSQESWSTLEIEDEEHYSHWLLDNQKQESSKKDKDEDKDEAKDKQKLKERQTKVDILLKKGKKDDIWQLLVVANALVLEGVVDEKEAEFLMKNPAFVIEHLAYERFRLRCWSKGKSKDSQSLARDPIDLLQVEPYYRAAWFLNLVLKQKLGERIDEVESRGDDHCCVASGCLPSGE